MAGSLRQRGDNSWELRVYDGVDPATRRRRYATRTVRGSRREAQSELESFATQVGYPRRRALSITMGELFDQWYANASPGWAANTARHTHSVLKVHLHPRFGHLAVSAVTTADIDAFYAELRSHGGRDRRPLADGTVRRVHGVLHRALAQAVRWQWIWTNPAEHASAPIFDQREITSPPPVAVARLLAATKQHPDLHAYFRLSVSTGARRGQLCALRWYDIDLERGAVSFARSLAEGPEGRCSDEEPPPQPRRDRPGDPSRRATPPRPGCMARPRSERRAPPWRLRVRPRRARRYPVATELGDQAILSPPRRGRPCWLSLHDLRHFMATEMLAAGVPIPIVAARLAHARSSTTLNVYAHAVPGGDRHAAECLAALLDDSSLSAAEMLTADTTHATEAVAGAEVMQGANMAGRCEQHS